MKLEQVIFALTMRDEAAERPVDLARYAFMEWLGTLNGDASFVRQAEAARARIGSAEHPALRAFVRLLDRALADPFEILPLSMPVPARRGGRKRLRL